MKTRSNTRSIDALSTYLRGLKDCPPLEREEELELANRYLETGDQRAADRLVQANLRAVVKIASRYQRPDVGLLELIQEGNMGLIQAVRRFNPTRGVRLVTYASWWVRAYVQRYLQEKLPHTTGTVSLNGANLNSVEDEGPRRRSIPVKEISLDQPMGDEARNSLSAMLADERPTQEESLMEAQSAIVLKGWVQEHLRGLDVQERQVIASRYLHESPRTLKEIGAEMGLSRQRIHQIELKARRKLGAALQSDPHPFYA